MEVYKPKTIAQLDALVDFVFNLGIGNFKKSTLLKCLQAGKGKYTIIQEFQKWVNANGKPLYGLVKRRNWEIKRYFERSCELTDEDIEINKLMNNV